MGAHADGVAVKHLIHDRARYKLELVPELFPILRHAQFEDMLNRNFADTSLSDTFARGFLVSHEELIRIAEMN